MAESRSSEPEPIRDDRPAVVTGAAGFVGREVVRLLALAGCPDVRAVDIVAGAPTAGARAIPLDLLRDDLSAAFRGAATVFHLAACQYHSTLAPNQYDLPFDTVNVEGTRRALAAARAAQVARFVHASSSMVYGIPRRVPIDEAHPLAPIGPYGRSKLAAERLVRDAAGGGMETVIVRPPPIFGPGRTGAIIGLFDRILDGRPVVLFGSGRNVQDLIDRDDCARLMVAVGRDRSGRDVFNAGSAAAPTMIGWMAALVEEAGSPSALVEAPALPIKLWLRVLERARLAPLRREQYEIADRDYVLDWSAARAIGWTPRATGIEAALAGFRAYRAARGATSAAR
ncbi:MAG: NAD(P)-dependent oxidoreductase [Candidatus Eisenbacteria bacterium]|nr:NAD(P)-dependent oxidoreductase [Candidatus Eisenbacteria bacterium]